MIVWRCWRDTTTTGSYTGIGRNSAKIKEKMSLRTRNVRRFELDKAKNEIFEYSQSIFEKRTKWKISHQWNKSNKDTKWDAKYTIETLIKKSGCDKIEINDDAMIYTYLQSDALIIMNQYLGEIEKMWV